MLKMNESFKRWIKDKLASNKQTILTPNWEPLSAETKKKFDELYQKALERSNK